MRPRATPTWCLLLLTSVLGAVTAGTAGAATFTPTTTADGLDGACDVHCTLREAITAANAAPGPDEVRLGPGIYLLGRPGSDEDAGATGDLDVTGDLTLVGAGAASTFIDGNGTGDRVLDVQEGAVARVSDLTVREGHIFSGPPFTGGAGIRNRGTLVLRRAAVMSNSVTSQTGGGGGGGIDSAGVLEVSESTISHNVGFFGGGIYASGRIFLTNVTVSTNAAVIGGGLLVEWDTPGAIVATTVTENIAQEAGGGIAFNEPPILPRLPAVDVGSTILAGNRAPAGPDCHGLHARSRGSNLVGIVGDCTQFGPATGDRVGTEALPIDPALTHLTANGGPTLTHAPLPVSASVDAVPAAAGDLCPAIDQRGRRRPLDGNGDGVALCDIGAVERSGACETVGPELCLHGRFRATATFRTPQGLSGEGQAVALTDDSGAFWFFDPANLEVIVKVLDACAPFERYWVFAAGLTNLEVALSVEDTVTDRGNLYLHAQGRPFRPILDTDAFATCNVVGGNP